MSYVLAVLIALDQLVNAILGGSPDETLSARAWRTEQSGKGLGWFFRPLIDGLALVLTFGRDRNHCKQAYLSELKKRQLPKDYTHADSQTA